MGKLSLSKMLCVIFVFCVTTVMASPAQTFTIVASFDGNNAKYPQASVIQGADGNFYGTAPKGGNDNYGTVFKVTPGGTVTMLYSFADNDGAKPWAPLMQASDGNFYGTTSWGGTSNNCYNNGVSGCGTVFKITPAGTLTTLYSFSSSDGSNPTAGLVQASDGNFYGTSSGAPYTDGTVFKITPAGTLTTLHTFLGSDGATPTGGLLQASDGDFYGTTYYGGTDNDGTVFKITSGGTLTTLHNFASSDGAQPWGGLVQASDGNFYGTTSVGGTNGGGTVFKITPAGTLTTLYNFCAQSSCADGATAYDALMQASDGNLYGTTYIGGAYNYGTMFKITLGGTLTTLHSFCAQPYCSDGSHPFAGLVQASNGSLYGTTYDGGGNGGYGTVFSQSPSPEQFVAVTPCRLVDTRPQNGGGGPIQGGTFESFNLPQLAQSKGCANLSSAAAYSLNITVVPSGQLDYLTIWPAGTNQPLVSTMNSLDGRIKANAAIVPAGYRGAVSVFVTNTTNVVLDIDGYFTTPGAQTLQFYSLIPCRVLDTRNANGPLGGPFLTTGVERDFPVLESSCIPPGVTPQAYSMNFTVVPYQGQLLGYLTVWPQGGQRPVVSTLNNPTATIVANAAIVPAGTGGGIAVYPSGNTQLAVDIDGYFAAAGSGGLSLYPAMPCRAIDTRKGNGAFSGKLVVDVVDSVCDPPTTAQAYVFNATVVPVGGLGYLTLWPDTEQQPLVSTLNATDGVIASNMAIVPNINGKTDAYASGTTQLILDISSYFAP